MVSEFGARHDDLTIPANGTYGVTSEKLAPKVRGTFVSEAGGTDGEPSGGTGDEGGGDGQDSGGTGGETTPKQTVVTLSPAPRLVNTAPLLGNTVTVPRTLVLTFDYPITVSAGAIEVYGETRGARAGYSITYNDGKRTVHVEWKSPPEGCMSGGSCSTSATLAGPAVGAPPLPPAQPTIDQPILSSHRVQESGRGQSGGRKQPRRAGKA